MSVPAYQQFNLIRHCNKKLKTPRPERHGELKFYNGPSLNGYESNHAYLCIKNRNKYEWREIGEVSATKLGQHKEAISEQLEEMYLKVRAMENSHNVTKRKLKSKDKHQESILLYMFNKMDAGQRIAFYMQFPEMQQQFLKYKCSTCSNLSNKQFKKCRHDDCPGMCETCYKNWQSGTPVNDNGVFVFGHMSCSPSVCPACKKSQDYQCPICYDEKPEDDIMFSDNCDHFVCKSCFCNSFNSNPIVDCPMCRSQFRDTLSKTNYADGMQEDAIII